jgi:hypothetical protein
LLRILINVLLLVIVFHLVRSVWRRALGRFERPKPRADTGGNPGTDSPKDDKLSPYEIEDAEIEEIKGKD